MKEPTLGHYASKMLEEWTALRDKVRRQPSTPTGTDIDVSSTYLVELIEDAVCWTVSPTAFPLVWNTDVTTLDFENQRLPFPIMCIEYNFDYSVLGFSEERIDALQDPAFQRMLILFEISETEFAMMSCYKPRHNLKEVGINWSISPIALVFNYSHITNLQDWFRPNGETIEFEFNMPNGKSPRMVPALPMFNDSFDKFTEKEINGLMRDMADEINVSFGLLGILSCGNAPVREILPPAQLNKKRVKNGKHPLPTYRTLHISDHSGRAKNSDSHGGHASPKTHWRRGHIRNQPTAKGYIKKWIRPTIVGSGVAPKPEVVLT